MAKQALRKNSSEEEVFELDKDERWQARLAEARARRAVALRDKANAGDAPKGRSMPWEGEDVATVGTPVETVVEAKDSDRLDFSDRVDSLRRSIEPPEGPGTPAAGGGGANKARAARKPRSKKPAAPQAPAIARKKVAALPGDFRPAKPYVPPARPAPLPAGTAKRPSGSREESERLAATYAATMLPDQAARVADGDAPTPHPVQAKRFGRRGVPAMLLAGVCLLAILPFSTRVMPMERGLVPYSSTFAPKLGLVPALGITRSMVDVPVRTSPGNRRVQTTAPRSVPAQTLAYAPLQQREMASLPPVTAGVSGPGELGWTQIVARPTGLTPVLGTGPEAEGLPTADLSPTRILPPLPRGEAVRGPATVSASASAPRVADDLSAAVVTAPIDASSPFLQPLAATAPTRAAQPALLAQPGPDFASSVQTSGPDTAPLHVLRVTVLVPARASEELAQSISEDVAALGHDLAAVKRVNLTISERNIRFYHAEDRAEAARLAEALDARLRDFTSFRPLPADGTVEIWMSGRSVPTVAKTKPKGLAWPSLKRQPATRTIVIQRRPSLLDRLFGGLGVSHDQTGRAETGGSSGTRSVRTGSTAQVTAPQVFGTPQVADATGVTAPGTFGGGVAVSDSADSGTDGGSVSAEGTTSIGGSTTSDSGSTDAGATDTSSSGTGTTSGDSGSTSGASESSDGGGKSGKSGGRKD